MSSGAWSGQVGGMPAGPAMSVDADNPFAAPGPAAAPTRAMPAAAAPTQAPQAPQAPPRPYQAGQVPPRPTAAPVAPAPAAPTANSAPAATSERPAEAVSEARRGTEQGIHEGDINLVEVLEEMLKYNSSDLHLTAKAPPTVEPTPGILESIAQAGPRTESRPIEWSMLPNGLKASLTTLPMVELKASEIALKSPMVCSSFLFFPITRLLRPGWSSWW